MRTLNILLAAATSMAAVAIAQTANAFPANSPAAAPAEQATPIQVVRYGGGFPVYAFGPIPSGFGNELRTGRPYYAGSAYAPRTYTYSSGYRDHRHVRPRHRHHR